MPEIKRSSVVGTGLPSANSGLLSAWLMKRGWKPLRPSSWVRVPIPSCAGHSVAWPNQAHGPRSGRVTSVQPLLCRGSPP